MNPDNSNNSSNDDVAIQVVSNSIAVLWVLQRILNASPSRTQTWETQIPPSELTSKLGTPSLGVPEHHLTTSVCSSSSTSSLTDRITQYRVLHGRTFHNFNDSAYWLVVDLHSDLSLLPS